MHFISSGVSNGVKKKYIYIYKYIVIGEKTERIYLHPYKPVSWLLTHRPDEWVITKQACKDESIVSLFFSSIAIYITLYSYVSSTVKRKTQCTDFLFIYIYIYISYLKRIIILTHRVFKTLLQFYKLSLRDAFYTKWNVFEETWWVSNHETGL